MKLSSYDDFSPTTVIRNERMLQSHGTNCFPKNVPEAGAELCWMI